MDNKTAFHKASCKGLSRNVLFVTLGKKKTGSVQMVCSEQL